MSASEVEETFKRLSAYPGVQGVDFDKTKGIIVINNDGIPVRTTFNQSRTSLYVGLIHGLILKAKMTIKEMDPHNELEFVRLRSHRDEILIAPDKEFCMIVVQNPQISSNQDELESSASTLLQQQQEKQELLK